MTGTATAAPAGPVGIEGHRVAEEGRIVPGVLSLLIGLSLAWIPLIGYLGDVLILLGFFYVHSARQVFGSDGSRWVVRGANLLLAAIIAELIALAVIDLGVGSLATSGPPAVWYNLVIGEIFTALAALAVVYLAHGLADRTTATILWGAYAASLATVAAAPFVPGLAAVNQGFLRDLSGSATLRLATGSPGIAAGVPYLLFAWGYSRALGEARRRFGLSSP
jgi:hypothetical protein